MSHAFPAPADAAAAARLAADLSASADGSRIVAEHPGAVAAIGGNSPFLTALARRDPGLLAAVLCDGAAPVVAGAMATLAALAPAASRAETARTLREAKRAVALATAIADLGGAWTLDAITGALSDFAAAALECAVAHLVADAAARGQTMRFCVLGMGKLGARELNYSSDVDLILLFDPAAWSGDPDRMVMTHARLARDLATLMEARDADGYVFRVDYRLRPDPGSTPAAMPVDAAITYYEAFGQNWERAAMIKARPVAGDLALGQHVLDAIRPFVWRRRLDFAAIADIRAMKRRIEARAPGSEDFLGQNVKTGPGGIREIELLVQTLQLVWGGREPGLRDRGTVAALGSLVSAGHVTPGARARLVEAYVFLRTIEHRLQMVGDRQTHALPATAAEFAAFAIFAGFAAAGAFAAAFRFHTAAVRAEYAAEFRTVDVENGSRMLDLRGPDTDPATLETLRQMGFAAPEPIADTLRAWQAGRVPALRSERARALLDGVLPLLLAALGQGPDPDAAFSRAQEWFAHLPAGVQPLSLLQHNPALLDRIATILGAAPSLAASLARMPGALEALLLPDADADFPGRIAARVALARDLQDTIDAIRDVVRAEEFALSAATLETGRGSAGRRTALADAALGALLPAVLDDVARRHGTLDGALAIVGLGKLGGREMMHGSDLDLMIVSAPGAQAESSAGVAAGVWFSRAAHALVAAITARGPDGPLYEVDMRLRPSGNKGPVAVGLDSFVRYHQADAWTWERMALTRARVVAGPPGIAARLADAVAHALRRPGDPARVRGDVAAMRARLMRDLPAITPWDLKHREGGLMEAEFCVQGMRLALAARGRDPGAITSTADGAAFLRDAGMLAAADAATLIRADALYRAVQEALRIAIGPRPPARVDPAAAGPFLRAAAAAGESVVDLAALAQTLDAVAAEVRRVFRIYVEIA